MHLRERRLVCPVLGCLRQAFREQIPGLLECHQRRTVRLANQISQVARELCGRANARLAGLLAVPVSRSTALRHLRRLPLPQQPVPQVIGVDDFALPRRHRYATIITDAETGRRVAVLPDREVATLESWLREHPGVEIGCRDGSAPTPRPSAAPCPQRCRSATRSPWPGRRPARLRRRLGLALNTVKRYARMPEPHTLRIAPAYRPTLADPYRDHLRERRRANPAIPTTQLLRDIRELGYTGSANLLVRYLNQGRAEGDRPVTTPRHASRLLLTDPENLRPKEAALLEKITAVCPKMTQLADLVCGFAALLKPADGNDVTLTEWITTARAADLPHLRGFTNGLEIDRPAVNAGLTCPVTTAAPKASTPAPNGSRGRCADAPDSISFATASSYPDQHPASPPATGQTRSFDRPVSDFPTSPAESRHWD